MSLYLQTLGDVKLDFNFSFNARKYKCKYDTESYFIKDHLVTYVDRNPHE